MEFWNLSSIMLSLSTGSNSERKLSFFKFLFNHILMSTLANLGGRISKAQLDFGFHSWCFILTDRNVVLEYLANHIFVYLRPDHDFRLVAKRCDEVCHSFHYVFGLKKKQIEKQIDKIIISKWRSYLLYFAWRGHIQEGGVQSWEIYTWDFWFLSLLVWRIFERGEAT